jgi:tetratricopeptide (TPR) repeat protein
MEMTTKCSKCGKDVSTESKFCPECGSALKQKSQKKQKSHKSTNTRKSVHKSSGYTLIYLVAVLSILISIFYGYQYFVPTTEKHIHSQENQSNQAQKPQIDQKKLDELIKLVNANPEGIAENINLGNFLFDNHQYEKALVHYKKAIELDNKNTEVIVDAGVSYFNLKNFEEATHYFKNALEINPNHPNALYNLGIVSAQTGNMSVMIEAWNTLIEVAPESGPAQTARRMLEQVKGKMSK